MAVRVAVVGLGGIGRNHASIYQRDPLSELIAVCDVDKGRVDAAAAQFHVPAYTDLADLINHNRPDVLSVATAGPENGGHHFTPTIQALEAGIPVLCEKPLSNSLAEAKQMVAHAKKLGVLLAVDLNHRFTPATDLAKHKVLQGELGQLLIINMNLWIANRNDSAPYFHLRALHSHSVDVLRHFGGDVASVQAFFSKGPGRAIWSNASINMQFENGILGHLTGSYDMSGNHSIERTEVIGNQGRVVIDNSTVDLHWYPHGSREELHIHNAGGMTSFSETMPARLHRFLEQVSAGVTADQLEGSGEEALKAQAVIEAAIRSHETGKVVSVAGILAE